MGNADSGALCPRRSCVRLCGSGFHWARRSAVQGVVGKVPRSARAEGRKADGRANGPGRRITHIVPISHIMSSNPSRPGSGPPPPVNSHFDQSLEESAHAKSVTPPGHRHSRGSSHCCGVAVRRRDRFGGSVELRRRTILGSDYQHLPDTASGGRLWARSVLERVVQCLPAVGSALINARGQCHAYAPRPRGWYRTLPASPGDG